MWRHDTSMSLTRDGGRLSVRVFQPEYQQSDRCIGAGEAAALRGALIETLASEGFDVRFSDALFCERGQKGWAVLATARRRG